MSQKLFRTAGYYIAICALLPAASCDSAPVTPAVDAACERSALTTCPVDYSQLLAGNTSSTTNTGDTGGSEPVSLRRDLMPMFYGSCTERACHDSTEPKAQLCLGAEDNCDGDADCLDLDATRLHHAIVDIDSRTTPRMSIVTSGDPANSFMLWKMSGCQAGADLDCNAEPGALGDEPCGDPMPRGAAHVDACNGELEFLILARWIAEGAADN